MAIEENSLCFAQPEPGFFIITKYSQATTSEKLIAKYREAGSDTLVPFFHGTRADIGGTLNILSSPEHGVIQPRNRAVLSIDPRSGYWVGGGLIYLVPRNDIAFPGEEQAPDGVKVGEDGLVSMNCPENQESLALSILDHKAYLAYGQTNEREICGQEKEAIVTVNKSLDEARASIDNIRADFAIRFLEFKSATREILSEYNMQQLEELFGSSKLGTMEGISASGEETSKILTEFHDSLRQSLVYQQAEKEKVVAQERALQNDVENAIQLEQVKERAFSGQEQLYKIINKKGLLSLLSSRKDRKIIDSILQEIELEMQKISTGAELEEKLQTEAIPLFLTKYRNNIGSVKDVHKYASDIAIELANLEYGIEMFKKETTTKQTDLTNTRTLLDRRIESLMKQVSILSSEAQNLSNAVERYDNEFKNTLHELNSLIFKQQAELKSQTVIS